MALNEVKFKQGLHTGLTQALATANTDTIFASTDKPVLAIGGQLYYGQPTIAYENDKIVMYGVSGETSVKLGEVDLTLESFLEGAQYIPGTASTEGYSPETAAYTYAHGVSTAITQEQVTAAYTTAFGASYAGDKSAVVMVMHAESSSGDTHSVVILPIGKLIGDTQTEIDAIETGVGLKSDGTYSADTTTNYVSAATSVQDAIKKLDSAIAASSSEGALTSPNETLNVKVAASGTTADVNHDKVTIKQSTGITFDNGDTVADNDLYAADAVIEDTFTVLGKNVGNLNSGTEIKGGTTVVELLKQILVKEADCTAVKPTCTLTISPTTSPVEVGTVVSETLSSTYADGRFTGDTEEYGKVYDIAAGCTQGAVTYKRGETTVTSPDSFTMPDGTTTWSCTSAYGASSVTPKKNTGDDSSVSIAAGTTEKSEKSITAYYKWYLGNTTAASVADIVLSGENANVSGVVTGWTSASTVTMKSTWSSNGKSIFMLVKGTVTSFKDNLSSESLLPNFASADKTIAIGGTSTETYKGYLWTITNGAVITAKDIKMNK